MSITLLIGLILLFIIFIFLILKLIKKSIATKEIYRATFLHHLSLLLLPSLFFSVGLILFVGGIVISFGDPAYLLAVLFGALLTVYIFPTLALYFRFKKNEKGKVIVYDKKKLSITITQYSKTIVFTTDDVEKIIDHQFDNGEYKNPRSSFSYFEFLLKNGQKIFITNLISGSSTFYLFQRKVVGKTVYSNLMEFRPQGI